ncbi:MAG: LPXTG cell wall anchor domain-containing protein [Actinomycetota bacterium]
MTGADTLPRTGEDSLPLAQMGVVLVGLGALVVLFARKRGDTRT